MAGFIACVIFLILFFARKKKPRPTTRPLQKRAPAKTAVKPATRAKTATATPTTHPTQTVPAPANMTPPPSADHSIIDVTHQDEKIVGIHILTPKKEVVPWPHRYVYAYNELTNATREQRSFYHYFRECFLKEVAVELKGNSNYAFILLFDLLQEYDKHGDISLLQNQLFALSKFHPVTAPYAKTELLRRLHEKTNVKLTDKYPQAAGDPQVTRVPQPTYQSIHGQTEWVSAYPAIGTKFKAKIQMSEIEEKMLNNMYYGSNIFFSNNFCQQSTIGVFLNLWRGLISHFAATNSSLDERLASVGELIAKKHYHYRDGSDNYKYCLSSSRAEMRILLMKCCENALRERYDFKRRLNLQTAYTQADIQTALQTSLIEPANLLLPKLVQDCLMPDEETDIYLNTQNTTRWKARLDELKAIYTKEKNSKVFLQEVLHLGRRNKGNPSIENIFYEASKVIGKSDKLVCLLLYVHYIYYDQVSEKIDDKPLNKALLKSLLTNSNSENAFDKILAQLKADKDLQKALDATNSLFETKRKKIRLDETRIEEVETAFTDTVELLNDYLDDEEVETPAPSPVAAETPPVPDAAESNNNHYLPALQLTSVQRALLELFTKHNFLLGTPELEAFAKEKGAFKNRLVDSINEACFETLDDTLIEQEDDNYIISEHSYQRVVQS